MDKRGFFSFVFIIFTIFAITGCTGDSRSRRGVTNDFIENYRTGTESLYIEFAQKSMKEVFENTDPITIPIKIENRGAFPQPEEVPEFIGRIWVGGFDRNMIELVPEEYFLRPDELLGRGPTLPDGGETVVLLRGRTWNLPAGSPSVDQQIQVALTYLYRTIASTKVCIDPDPTRTAVKDTTCEVEDYRSLSVGSGQGGPITIDSIQENAARGQIIFKIEISNSGDGIVIHPDDIDKSPFSGYDLSRIDKVRLSDINIGGIRLTECRPSIGEYVTLYDDEGFIWCKYNTNGIGSTFSSNLNIKLDYGYSISEGQDIKIFKNVIY